MATAKIIEDEVEEVIEDNETEVEWDQEEEEIINVEDLDPEVEIWPGGPTAGNIVAWKEAHDDIYLSSFTDNYHVVWRPMNRFEYKMHVKNMEKMTQSGAVSQAEAALVNEEAICEICVLFPSFSRDKIPSELAGAPSTLAEDILEASGFVALEVRKL